MATLSRKVFGTEGHPYPLTNLIDLQTNSYKWLLEEGIKEILDEVSPIEDFTGKTFSLKFLSHAIGEPKYSPEKAIEKGASFSAPIKVKSQLLNKETGETLEQEVFLGDLPLMTDSGTFIINGVERVIVTQLTRSSGIFYTSEQKQPPGKGFFKLDFHQTPGGWFRL